MRKISGTITSTGNQEIPNGAVAFISVIDCGRMDMPAITLGKIEIKEPKDFPIHYEIEYDDSFLTAQQFHGQYCIDFRIECDEHLIFTNHSNLNIVTDGKNRKVLDTLDFDVVSV